MAYFSDFRWSLSERPVLMVARHDSPDLAWIAPKFEEDTLREELGADVPMFFWEEDENPYALIRSIITPPRGVARNDQQVLLDSDVRFFVSDGLQGALGNVGSVRSGAYLVTALREIKSPAETALIECSQLAAKAAIAAAAAQVQVGMSEGDIEPLIHAALRDAGLTSTWAIALNGPNAAFPHGTGQQRPAQDGDLVLVDAGGLLHGYQSDCTRTFPAGPSIPADARAAWDAVRSAQEAAFAIAKPGTTLGDLDAAARGAIEAAGYGAGYTYFSHRLGHGIGLSIHEDPFVVANNSLALAPGMVITIEPGVYIPDVIGIRIEDIIEITETGYRVYGPLSPSVDDPFAGH